jgi:hypothetical protein
MVRKITYSIALLLLFTFTAQAGGGWTQPKGKGYYKLSEWWLVFDQHYTDKGEIDPNVTTGLFHTFVYAEHGITDRFTGIFNGAIFSRNYTNNVKSSVTGETIFAGEALNSIGDIDLIGKYSITKPGSSFPFAASLLLGIPTGNSSGGLSGNLQTGDGEFNQMLQVDLSKGLSFGKKVSFYANSYVAYNNRTKGYSSEFRYGLEGGFGLFKQKLWLVGKLFGVQSLKNGNTGDRVTSNSVFANDVVYSSYSYEANYYVLKNFGVSASFASAFRGEVIAAAPSYSVGVFWDTSK